jgi:hypothetical protein
MDPTMMLMASSVIGKAAGPAMPAGPSSAFDSGGTDWMFDSSGWNVNFGQGATVTSQATKTQSDPIGLAALGSGLSMNWQTIAVIGLGIVAVWAIVRR